MLSLEWDAIEGQQCWDLFSDITKTSYPSPPAPNQVEFWAPWVEMNAFFGHNIAGRGGGGGGGRGNRMNPKPIKKLSLVAESYVTITWRGFFTQSQVVLSSIVGYSQQYVVCTHLYTLTSLF